MSEKGTEKATPQREKKAKEKGDTVRSREFLSAVAMLGGIAMLGATMRSFLSGWEKVYTECLRSALVRVPGGEWQWSGTSRMILAPALLPVAAVMLASFAGALLSGVGQGGGVEVHPNALELKFARLNPVTNMGNIFSLRTVTRLFKSLIPAAAVVVLGWDALKNLMQGAPVMALSRLPQMFSTAYGLALDAAWVTLLWSGLDYVIEWRSWNQRLRMTKQEMREEMREAMGDPHVKARIRQVQMAMRRRRVKADMSRASVVITNPTHYAVALEFSFETMQAPRVLAKGRDLLAAEIREEARWHGIPMIENPPLARSLYRSVEPGEAIPFELYAAVASILAYLYRQSAEERVRRENGAQRAGGERIAGGLVSPGGGM